ncbi:MAG: hypothetical protein JRI84_08530 [Deltaproteobacteria bacterium]|nr:hypothetical protein [Deltaproteobacteria bacterium]
MDWFSRHVLSRELSITLEKESCPEDLRRALMVAASFSGKTPFEVYQASLWSGMTDLDIGGLFFVICIKQR